MEPASLILVGLFLLLVFLGVPVAFCLGIASLATLAWLNVERGLTFMVLAQKMSDGIDAFSLLAIPFFILAGEIMSRGGIARRLIDFANACVGFVRGGLAMVTVLACMFFGGITGSSVAEASSIGSVLIPMMKKKGYGTDYAVGVTISASTQGIIIPPSHNAIIYALAAGGGVSIGKLFLGGVFPGIMVGLSLMFVAWLLAWRRNYPRERRMGPREGLRAAKDAVLGLVTILIIVGGVVLGVFTATESAAVAVLYAFVVTFFVYRDIPLREIGPILGAATRTSAMVILLISTASVFGWLMTYLNLPRQLSQFILSKAATPTAILMAVNLLLLALGLIMDMAPLILILTPVLLPVVQGIGMDPVHFGIVMMLNLGIGLCTPPVGSTMFVGCAIGGIRIEQLMKGMWPFYLAMIAVLALVTYWPPLTMWLPELMIK